MRVISQNNLSCQSGETVGEEECTLSNSHECCQGLSRDFSDSAEQTETSGTTPRHSGLPFDSSRPFLYENFVPRWSLIGRRVGPAELTTGRVRAGAKVRVADAQAAEAAGDGS